MKLVYATKSEIAVDIIGGILLTAGAVLNIFTLFLFF